MRKNQFGADSFVTTHDVLHNRTRGFEEEVLWRMKDLEWKIRCLYLMIAGISIILAILEIMK